jgi:hypothetical protein
MITGALTVLGTLLALVLWWLQNRGKNRHEYRDAVIEAERRKRDQQIDSWWTKRPPADS